jgi:hypothetical protein
VAKKMRSGNVYINYPNSDIGAPLAATNNRAMAANGVNGGWRSFWKLKELLDMSRRKPD